MDPQSPAPPTGPAYRLSLVPALAQVPAAEWDALLGPDDAPLLAHGYLAALEASGCVGDGTGWRPAHLLLRRGPPGRPHLASVNDNDGAGELCAAAPAYLKVHSDGEWVYDLEWARLAEHLGVAYYPKLVLAVPYNPVTGRRVLTPPRLPAAERAALCATLLQGARRLCAALRVTSLHALFPRADELPALRAAGLLARRQEQYHFINRGYRAFDDFLADLRHNRRRTIRKERQALLQAGITVRTHRGLRGHAPAGDPDDNFTSAELDQVHAMYEGTSRRYTGEPPYLSRDHFQRCARALGDRLELVLARDRQGQLLAGAFNLRGDTRLFGRHWGEAVHVPGLHFEVCLYHGIERCITLGLAAFEPGHGGDQKLLRGFAPVYTYSAHGVYDRRLQAPVARYLSLEAPLVDAALAAAQARCPLKALPNPEDPADPAWRVNRGDAAAVTDRDQAGPAADGGPAPRDPGGGADDDSPP